MLESSSSKRKGQSSFPAATINAPQAAPQARGVRSVCSRHSEPLEAFVRSSRSARDVRSRQPELLEVAEAAGYSFKIPGTTREHRPSWGAKRERRPSWGAKPIELHAYTDCDDEASSEPLADKGHAREEHSPSRLGRSGRAQRLGAARHGSKTIVRLASSAADDSLRWLKRRRRPARPEEAL